MNNTNRFALKRILPALKRRFNEKRFSHTWYNSKEGKNNQDYLLSLKGKYINKRLFLIANGPSIKDMDLSPLKDEYTMCMNRFYIYFEKLRFVPDFLVCIEDTVLEQFANDINNLALEKFVNWRFHNKIPNSNFIKEQFVFTPFFQDEMTKPAYFGGTVTYACLQLAYYMGFQEIVIIGLDHSFKEKGTPSTVEIRHYEKDESHFDPNYFPKGMKWKLPDLDKSEQSYLIAKKKYNSTGRKIWDATINGKCEVFDKANFNDFVKINNN